MFPSSCTVFTLILLFYSLYYLINCLPFIHLWFVLSTSPYLSWHDQPIMVFAVTIWNEWMSMVISICSLVKREERTLLQFLALEHLKIWMLELFFSGFLAEERTGSIITLFFFFLSKIHNCIALYKLWLLRNLQDTSLTTLFKPTLLLRQLFAPSTYICPGLLNGKWLGYFYVLSPMFYVFPYGVRLPLVRPKYFYALYRKSGEGSKTPLWCNSAGLTHLLVSFCVASKSGLLRIRLHLGVQSEAVMMWMMMNLNKRIPLHERLACPSTERSYWVLLMIICTLRKCYPLDGLLRPSRFKRGHEDMTRSR